MPQYHQIAAGNYPGVICGRSSVFIDGYTGELRQQPPTVQGLFVLGNIASADHITPYYGSIACHHGESGQNTYYPVFGQSHSGNAASAGIGCMDDFGIRQAYTSLGSLTDSIILKILLGTINFCSSVVLGNPGIASHIYSVYSDPIPVD